MHFTYTMTVGGWLYNAIDYCVLGFLHTSNGVLVLCRWCVDEEITFMR